VSFLQRLLIVARIVSSFVGSLLTVVDVLS
jgi:hypothetical protein